VNLSEATRAAHQQQSPQHGAPPGRGLTLGIGSILASRRILLLIAGAGKQHAAQALRRGVGDEQWPVTSLLGHPDVTVIELSGRD
jgi:glucosamine-6-phosphate deaminase